MTHHQVALVASDLLSERCEAEGPIEALRRGEVRHVQLDRGAPEGARRRVPALDLDARWDSDALRPQLRHADPYPARVQLVQDRRRDPLGERLQEPER